MLVEGINYPNSSYVETNKYKGRSSLFEKGSNPMSKTSQGFFSLKKEETTKPPFVVRDRDKDKPRSLTAVPTPAHVVRENTQENNDYYNASSSSVYNSEPGASSTSNISLSSALNKYLQGTYNPNDYQASRSKFSRQEVEEVNPSGRTTAPGKISTSTSSNKSNQISGVNPKTIPSPSTQASFSKTVGTPGSYSGNRTFLDGKNDIRSPQVSQGLTVGAYTSPKLSNNDTIYGKDKYTQKEDPILTRAATADSQAPLIHYNKIETFNASRYVFDGQKKKGDEPDRKSEGIEEDAKKRFSNSQEKRPPSPNYINIKAKSNEKAMGYNSYAGPSLAKMFKPTTQPEDEQKNKFYNTDFSLLKQYENSNNMRMARENNEKSYKDIKETSLADSFQIDPIDESKNRPGSGYLSSSKGFLDSYPNQGNPNMANTVLRKGNFAQILKETTSSISQRPETELESNLSSYQPFVKQGSLTYSAIPSMTTTTRNMEDTSRKGLAPRENEFYLDNMGADMLSPREVSSMKNITNGHSSPGKLVSGKMSERAGTKKKEMTIDTTLAYQNYTDMSSPAQGELLKNLTGRIDDGKTSSRVNNPSVNLTSTTASTSYYERNGIFKEFKLSQSGIYWLYKTFENIEFCFYASDYMKDPLRDEANTSQSTIATINPEVSNKRIIIVSKGTIFRLLT